MDQMEIFKIDEADNYFRRNEKHHNMLSNDVIVDLYSKYYGKAKIDILEIGCSDGWRLKILRDDYDANVYGIEPSPEACKKAKETFNLEHIICGTSDKFDFGKKFDLIMVPFVLHWIGRDQLLESVSNIDKHLKDGGAIIINDFWQNGFKKVKYHHRTDVSIWTYKQDYSKIFLSLGTYRGIHFSIYDYSMGQNKSGIYSVPSERKNLAFVSMCVKDSDFNYEEIR